MPKVACLYSGHVWICAKVGCPIFNPLSSIQYYMGTQFSWNRLNPPCFGESASKRAHLGTSCCHPTPTFSFPVLLFVLGMCDNSVLAKQASGRRNKTKHKQTGGAKCKTAIKTEHKLKSCQLMLFYSFNVPITTPCCPQLNIF